MKIPVTTIVDGVCCSAATFILLGGKKRLMKENSFVLIHQLSNTFWGKFEELKDEMETVTKLMEHIKNLYRKNTTLSETKLKRLMKRDVYLDGDECIRYNIVEGVI
jgi:ATP-dependent protease ClpP protease subunit